MNPRTWLLAPAVILTTLACRGQAAATTYGADETHRYLLEVGRVRTQVNTDNRDVIPKLLETKDPLKLLAQAKVSDGYRQALENLDPQNVDPDAIKFKDNFEKIVGLYQAVCNDSADLFRRIKEIDAKPGMKPLIPPGRRPLKLETNDTFGAIDSLMELLEHTEPSSTEGRASIQPAVDKLRGDEDSLKAAKAAHHDFSEKLKGLLNDRYEGTDWGDRTILP